MFRKLSITFLLSFLICPQLRAVDSGPSETERIQELERVVAELKQEVSGLKKQAASAAEVGARMKTKIMSEGKSYVETAVVEEEKPPVLSCRADRNLAMINSMKSSGAFRRCFNAALLKNYGAKHPQSASRHN